MSNYLYLVKSHATYQTLGVFKSKAEVFEFIDDMGLTNGEVLVEYIQADKKNNHIHEDEKEYIQNFEE